MLEIALITFLWFEPLKARLPFIHIDELDLKVLEHIGFSIEVIEGFAHLTRRSVGTCC